MSHWPTWLQLQAHTLQYAIFIQKRQRTQDQMLFMCWRFGRAVQDKKKAAAAAAAAPGSALNLKWSKQWLCSELMGIRKLQNESFNLAVIEDRAR